MANPNTPPTEAPAAEATSFVPPEYMPDYSKIVTEDDTPVDNIYSEKHQRLLTEPLHSSWGGPGAGRTYIACSDVGVFYALRLPPIVPDAFLTADVTLPADPFPKQNRSYFVWEYGKPPDIVIETVSNKEGGELDRKLDIYARVGVSYYVVWDPEQLLGEEKLHVFARIVNKFEPIAKAWFPSVNLGLTPWQGLYEDLDAEWLRWCDEQGEVIPTGAERANKEHELAQQQQERADLEQKRAEQAQRRAEQEKQRAEQEKQRAEQERQRAEQEKLRAEQERQRAEQEKLRAEQLEAMLRAHGIEPPSRST